MSNSAHSAAPPAPVAHHFDTAEQQFTSGKLGMWIFLSTEILLFGGLFCAYSVYRANHPEIFIYAHQFLSKTLGGVNTLVLICSSLTMAWAVRAAQTSRRKPLIILLALTFLFACCFLGIKYVEYHHKWKEGLLWGQRFDYKPHAETHAAATATGTGGTNEAAPATQDAHGATAPATTDTAHSPAPAPTTHTATAPPSGEGPGQVYSLIPPAASGPEGLASGKQAAAQIAHGHNSPPKNVQIFFGVYFVMTGLHGLHVIAGMIVIAWLLTRSVKGHFHKNNFAAVDLGGLYWHLVDLIWIYLFPLFYLIH